VRITNVVRPVAVATLNQSTFADYRAVTVTGGAVLGGGSLYYDTLGNFYGGVTFWLSQA
jgi:hypothetical protein